MPTIETWQASYSPRNGKPYSIDGIESQECPMSLATQHPELIDVLRIIDQADDQPGALGKPSEMPAAFYDMVTAVKSQERARDYFRDKATS
jgi:hypothetical protein